MSDKINRMFGRIADRYDAANTVLSFGIHRLWRSATVDALDVQPGDRILDGATGTGDLAFRLADSAGPTGHIVGLDFNREMLSQAQRKHRHRAPDAKIEWKHGDLLDLPYEDRAFDRAAVGFGIRNVDDPERALGEFARTLRPGGRLVILEFGQPDGALGALYSLYSKTVVPAVGAIITGDREAYEYLHQSSSDFPCGDDFADMLRRAAPFEQVGWRTLTGGIAYLYHAELPDSR